jgi:hypothetical protein
MGMLVSMKKKLYCYALIYVTALLFDLKMTATNVSCVKTGKTRSRGAMAGNKARAKQRHRSCRMCAWSFNTTHEPDTRIVFAYVISSLIIYLETAIQDLSETTTTLH